MVKGFGTRKLTDRLIIALAFAVLLVIILLIFHINMYIEMSKHVFVASRPEHNHKEINVARRRAAYRSKSESSSNERLKVIDVLEKVESKELFLDLHDALERMERDLNMELSSFSSTKRVSNPTLGELLHMKITENTTSLDFFHMQITENEMYPEDSPFIEKLLTDMATQPIRKVEEKDGGTQFKLTITYQNGMRALFKPKRLELNQQNPPNQLYYSEYERHNAEIAAFHVDRLLGYRRAVPTTGRTLNVITQIMRIGPSDLKKTFYKSAEPDENICFTGNCHQFCDHHHPICAKDDQLEGSFMAYLPDDEKTHRHTYDHPYVRSYHVIEKMDWETNPNYCEIVKKDYPVNETRELLDFIDTAILDFLIGNRDRHNYQTFDIFEDAFHMHYDHGRSFGRPFFDDMSILAPLTQCCVIRSSTTKKLLSFHHGPKSFSAALNESLSKDPLFPIVSNDHLVAIDRRVEIILKGIRKCVDKKYIKNVIIFK